MKIIILCGGAGKRVWPWSTPEAPKQFARLPGGGTLLDLTIQRARQLEPTRIVLCGSVMHRDLLRKAADRWGLTSNDVLLEPQSRNTFASVITSVMWLEELNETSKPVLVLPSDHHIDDTSSLWSDIQQFKDRDALSLFGKKAEREDCGKGYLQIAPCEGKGPHRVSKFVEKPQQECLRQLQQMGELYWNLGIFHFHAPSLIAFLKDKQPEVLELASQAAKAIGDAGGFGLELEAHAFGQIENIPFDKAVVEKFPLVHMQKARFNWSDLGTFESLHAHCTNNGRLNLSAGRASFERSSGILALGNKPIEVRGARDLVVVATEEACLVEQINPQSSVEVFAKAHVSDLDQWLRDHALPVWCDRAWNENTKRFHETLSLDGGETKRTPRLRTMARQTWCFAKTSDGDCHPKAIELAQRGIALLSAIVDSIGEPNVPDIDPGGPYDLACVLKAAAAGYLVGVSGSEALGESALRCLLLQPMATGSLLETHTSAESGFKEVFSSPGSGFDSETSMHFLDALLQWHAATGDDLALRSAEKIATRFRDAFFDRRNFQVLEGYSKEPIATCSPGHAMQWIALIVDAPQQISDRFEPRNLQRLHAMTLGAARRATTGLIALATTADGSGIKTANTRAWVLCESIRAALALRPQNSEQYEPLVEEHLNSLFQYHLSPAQTGLWVDEVSLSGKALSRDVPASIFSHLVGAWLALSKHRLTVETNAAISQ